MFEKSAINFPINLLVSEDNLDDAQIQVKDWHARSVEPPIDRKNGTYVIEGTIL